MITLIALSVLAMPQHESYASDQTSCLGAMEYWDVGEGMCLPLPMTGMPMQMLMVHGNAFGVYTSEQGPRGRRDISAPNMMMVDAGKSVGDNHYINLDLMATAERWTFPENGTPELLQIGESNDKGVPFVDAQHPHSSPIMGVTLSDTMHLPGGSQNHLKLFVAPRGESTDGPIAFMHRPTGMVNPDAPLGHHIGQDVGHISSTVVGASLGVGGTTVEASGFSGREPEPDKIDLPLGKVNSYSFRIVEQLSPRFTIMGSAAYVDSPEPDDPSLKFVTRYSASAYLTEAIGDGWTFYDSLIYGLIHNYDRVGLLNSYCEEFLFRGGMNNLWGRVEVLQRTAVELEILEGGEPTLVPRWITAATLGYTRTVATRNGMEVGVGGSATKDFLPREFQGSYGGDPWTGKFFLQISGMKMFGM